MRSAASIPTRNRLRLGLLRLAGRALARPGRPPVRAERVLLLRPDHAGDVLLGAPAVALLRASLPAARLTYLVGPWSADAARHGPAVDDVRTLEFPGFTRRPKRNVLEPYIVLAREAMRLRQEGYDLAVALRGDHWWGALLTVLAGIPLRVGGATPETRRLLTHTYAARDNEPAAERALGTARLAVRGAGAAIVEVGNVTQYVCSNAAREAASDVWRQHALGGRVIAIHPSAGAPLKSWPVERWAQLADALLDLGVEVVLTGAADDARLLASIARRTRQCPVQLCGQSLDTSAAVFQRCRLVVSVDSGAGHLAAAVGTPTIRLYGPVSASVFGPWPPRGNQHVLATEHLACAPCGHLEAPPCGARAAPACMLALGVSDVLNAVKVELGQS